MIAILVTAAIGLAGAVLFLLASHAEFRNGFAESEDDAE